MCIEMHPIVTNYALDINEGASIMANKKVKAIKSEIKSRKKTIAKQEVKLKKAKKALKKAA